jgi:hypothetical protein
VEHVAAVTIQDPTHPEDPTLHPFQQVTVRNPHGNIPTLTAKQWQQVEVSATRAYVNPHQKVAFGNNLQGVSNKAVLFFGPLQSWSSPIGTGYAQDLGALGIFYFRNWIANGQAQTVNTTWADLQVVGDQDLRVAGLPRRNTPAQAVLKNAAPFIEQDREWCFDPATRVSFAIIPMTPTIRW